MKKLDRRAVIFKVVYYLITLTCLCTLGVAVSRAYLNLSLPLVLWIVIALLIVIYFKEVVSLVKKRRGFKKFVAHCLTLQLIPLSVALLTLGVVPKKSTSMSEFASETSNVSDADTEQVDEANDKKPSQTQSETESKPQSQTTVLLNLKGKPRDYERHFNDLQNKQKAAAVKNGLKPFKSREEVEAKYEQLYGDNKLVKISSNSNYIVRELTSSSPYVVPKMAKLLDDIATSFQGKSQSSAKFVITSVLRTEEDVAKLRKINGNASTASCHCNATTVDISYVRFGVDDDNPREDYHLRLALAQTIHELRKAGRCYVKQEKKQYCYHITVR